MAVQRVKNQNGRKINPRKVYSLEATKGNRSTLAPEKRRVRKKKTP